MGDGASAEWIAPKRVNVVSTHGAGDCFVGVLAARLAGGDFLRQAAGFANPTSPTGLHFHDFQGV
jgi:sugar/nucleoside kinase (ribokinase family)